MNYYYNSVHISGTNSGDGSSYAFLRFPDFASLGAAGSTITLRNNLFVNSRIPGTASSRAIGVISTAGPSIGWNAAASNYNFFAAYSASTVCRWGGAAGTNHTFAQWQSLSLGDANSAAATTTTGSSSATLVNPAELFTNPLSDLHILVAGAANSFASNKGTNVSVTTDIDGDTRGSSPDLGIDEFIICQPLVADFTASATTVNIGQVVTLSDATTNNPTAWAWTLTGGTPSSSTAQNPTVSYSTPGTYSITLQATNACSNDTETKTNYITVVGTTRWTAGAFTDDWFTAGNWTFGVPTPSVNAVIPDKATTNNISPNIIAAVGIPAQTKSLDIEPDGQVTVSTVNNSRLDIYGDLTNNGIPSFGDGKVKLVSGASHTIAGASTFNDLEIDAATTLSGTMDVRGTLLLSSGQLNTTGGTLTIKSTAAKTGNIDDFSDATPGSILGDVTVERYVDNVNSGFHYIGSPVSGTTIADWGSEFSIAAMNGAVDGSQVVPTASCDPTQLAAGSPYGGLFDYRENRVSTCNQSGWHVRTTGALSPTLGFAGVVPNGTLINVTGTANTGNYTTPALTRTASNTAMPGRNMISNPYPSQLDWQDVATDPANTGITGNAHIWVTSGSYNGTYQVLNGIVGGAIGSSQAFFVVANTNNATVTFRNSMRSVGNNTAQRSTPVYENRLDIELSGNGFADKTILAFGSNFTTAEDRMYDATKMLSRTNQPTLYTSTNPALPLQSINALPSVVNVTSVPMGLMPGTSGSYTFTAQELSTFDATALIFLEDLKTGTVQNLRENPVYNFYADVADNADRFLLHFVPAAKFTATDASCAGADGAIQVDFGNYTVNGAPIAWDSFHVTDASNNVVAQGTNASGGLAFANLATGNYTVNLTIGSYSVSQQIAVSGAIPVDASFNADVLTVLEGGAVNFVGQVSGGNTITWDFGDGQTETGSLNPVHVFAAEGVYTVTLTVTNGECTDSYTSTVTVLKQTVGIDENNMGDVLVYAYANDIVVNFKRFDQLKDVTMDVFDMTGRKVISPEVLLTGDSKYRFPVGHLAQGQYFVVLTGKDYQYTKKIMLNH
ncbi:MAG: PKD domain-containing protein [Chitinophagales bacterium]|nr:PKD domain-containing protein [Chitinophagales bacterium]